MFNKVPFNNYCLLRETSLVIDGRVWATWTPGDGVTARFASESEGDEENTTEEICEVSSE